MKVKSVLEEKIANCLKSLKKNDEEAVLEEEEMEEAEEG